MRFHAPVCATLALLLAACGSSSSQPATEDPTPPPAPSAEPAAEPPAAEPDIGEGIAWADKSHAQKIDFMKLEVVPAVKEIWGESPEPDEEVNCVLCHGESAMEGKFEMPNPKLPKLDPTDSFAAHTDEAAWLDFMAKKLTPTMVQTLGVEPYDMQTQEGFGCFGCHTMKSGQ